MPSLKDVMMKIGAVKKTKQITKAMNMVASAKLRRSQERIERFRPYADKFYEMLTDLAGKAEGSAHPLLEKREQIATSCIILVTSDRGLCGSFNNNLIEMAKKLANKKAAQGIAVKFICVGKKARDSIRKTEYEMVLAFHDRMNTFDFSLANEIGLEVIAGYQEGRYDEVVQVFSEFITMAKQEALVKSVLPIQSEAAEAEKTGPQSEYIYEPAEEALLGELLPRFVKVLVYRGLLSTSASEHASRMRAMDNATNNCNDLIRDLTLVYNKTRQAVITRELMDIVGGAEALK